MSATLACPRCGAAVVRKREWAVFCSERCRRNFRRTKRDVKPRPCAGCGATFTPTRGSRKYCRDECRMKAHNARVKVPAQHAYRRLRCHWCSGSHLSAACTNRVGETVKQYGTMGPNREYIPPLGVKVRVRHLPFAMFGDQLTESKGGCR